MSQASEPRAPGGETIEIPSAPAPGPTMGPSSTAVDLAASLPAVPGYEVLEEVGRGGMGVVYRSRHLRLNRIVALKMILAGGQASPAERARFVQEAEAIATLQHPGIVQVFEIGEYEGKPYLSLEFCGGGTLEKKLGGKPLPPREAAVLVRHLAEATQAAHAAKVVHRDLKPANVLLSTEEPPHAPAPVAPSRHPSLPKIADFGLAKRLDQESGQTRTGAILGTPSYVAPEQASGKTREVGPAADVYALGAILYECLTGRPPFLGATPLETLLQVTRQEPVPPTQLQPGVPRDLETVCLKCLQKEPPRRYPSAQELADDLGRFLNDQPIHARPAGALERAWRWCRRNPAVAAMTAGVALLLVLIAFGSAGAALLLRHERDLAKRNEADAHDNRERAEAAEGEVRRQLGRTKQAEADRTNQLWQSYLDQARAGRFSQQAGQRFAGLEAIRKAAAIRFDPVLRDEAIACLALPDLRPWRRWSPPEGTRGFATGPEGERAACWNASGEVRVVGTGGGEEVARITLPGTPEQVAFTPDGLWLGAAWREAGKGGFELWRMQPGGAKRHLSSEQPVYCWRASEDGRRLLLMPLAGPARLLDLPSGEILRTFDLPRGPRVELHPRGTHLAVHAPPRLLLIDLDSGRPLQVLPGTHVTDVRWYGSGQTLAVARMNTRGLTLVHLAPPLSPVIEELDTVLSGSLHFAAGWSDDLLSCTERWAGGVKLWHPRTGRHLLSAPGNNLEFSRGGPSGRLVAYQTDGAGTGRFWEAVPGREYRTLDSRPHSLPNFRAVAIHPSGRLLAAGSYDGVTLFDFHSGQKVAFLQTEAPALCFDPKTGALLTLGRSGVSHWPVVLDGDLPEEVEVGPPARRVVVPGTGDVMLGTSADGAVVVGNSGKGGWVHHTGQPQRVVYLQPYSDSRCIAVSPDGRWVVAGPHDTGHARVWDARTGHLVHSFGQSRITHVVFSPDGRWLATGGDAIRLWETGTWRPVASLGVTPFHYAFCFSPDGKTLAAETGRGGIRLIEVPSGKKLAELAAPDQDRVASTAGGCVMTFSPDGGHLAFIGMDLPALHVWDLRSLRSGLRKLDLDWQAPPLPPARPAAGRLTIRVRPVSRKVPGSAVALPPPPTRKASATEIDGWIQELVAGPAPAAAAALVEVGPPALPALTRAAERAARPALSRLLPVRRRLLLAEAMSPATIRLDLKDASLADALAALSKQWGIEVRPDRKVKTGSGSSRRVTLRLAGVPGWEALGRICRATGTGFTQEVNGTIVVGPWPLPPATRVVNSGPARLLLQGVRQLRTAALTGEVPEEKVDLRLEIGTFLDPRVRIKGQEQVRVIEARDDRGNSLVPESQDQGPTFGQYQAVRLNPPTHPRGTLELLRGVFPVTVLGGTREMGRVRLSAGSVGKSVTTFGGGTLTLIRFDLFGTSGQAQVAYQPGPLTPCDPQTHVLEVEEARSGRQLRVTNSNLYNPPGGQPAPRPQDLLFLAGGPGGVSWGALALLRQPAVRRCSGTVYFQLRDKSPGDLDLVIRRGEPVRTEVPFTFRNVPLP